MKKPIGFVHSLRLIGLIIFLVLALTGCKNEKKPVEADPPPEKAKPSQTTANPIKAYGNRLVDSLEKAKKVEQIIQKSKESNDQAVKDATGR